MMEMLKEIFEVCILPLLGILTAYLVSYIQVKKEELKQTTDNDLANKYIDKVAQTIVDCVKSTNQTYVDSLKKSGTFDEAAQKEAFKRTFNSVMALLSDEAKGYLTEIYGDLELYLTNKIEATVKENKG